MTQESDQDYQPRAPRFKVDDAPDTVVTVTRTEDDEHQVMQAQLVDVSQHGAKLRVPVNLRFEEALQVKIDVLGTDMAYHGVASVRHIRAEEFEGEEQWLVGCAIAPPISEETFAYLATASGKERRRFRRIPIVAEATVRRQTETQGTVVSLHNMSSGGICFSSPILFKSKELVKLTLEGNDGNQRIIEARICWQLERQDGYLAGCQFSSRADYTEVCACLSEHPRGGILTSRKYQATSRLVLAVAIVAMFVPPMITLLMQTSRVSAEAASYSQDPPVAKVNEPTQTHSPETAPSLHQPDETLLTAIQTESNQLFQESEELSEPAEPIDTEKPTEPELREWVDNTGKYRTEGTLAEATSEFVVLQKADGGRRKVPLTRLSDADHQYVLQWLDQQ